MNEEKTKVNSQPTSAIIPLEVSWYKLIVKLFLYKCSMRAWGVINIEKSRKTDFMSFMFEGKKDRIRQICGDKFLTDCKTILDTNELINDKKKLTNSEKKQFVRALGIDKSYLNDYQVQFSNKVKEGESEELLISIALAIAKFTIADDVNQKVTLIFKGAEYYITPHMIISFLDHPPLQEEFDREYSKLNDNSKVIQCCEFEAVFYSLVQRFRLLQKNSLKKPLDLNRSEAACGLALASSFRQYKEDQVYRSAEVRNNSLIDTIAQPNVDQPPLDSSNFRDNFCESQAKKNIQLLPLAEYLGISPHCEHSRDTSNQKELEMVLSFAKFKDKYDTYHKFFLTDENISKYGELMLKTACFNGHVKVVQYLLKAGVDPSKNEKSDIPILLCATMGGSILIFKLLFDLGISIKESTYNNYNIYDVSLMAEQYVFAIFLDRHYPYQKYFTDYPLDILLIAMVCNNENAIRSLVVDYKLQPTTDQIRWALNNKQLSTFTLLVSYSSDLKYLQDLMSYCVVNNLVEETRILLRKGISVNKPTSDGHSLLTLSINFGFTKMTKLLLEFHGEPDHIDSTGIPLLVRATLNGSSGIVLALLKANANTRLFFNDKSLIEIAIDKMHYKLVALYISTGVFSPNDMLKNKRTLFENILAYFPSLSLVKTCLCRDSLNLITSDKQLLLGLALYEQCDISIISELVNISGPIDHDLISYRDEAKVYFFKELIDIHPQCEDLSELFKIKDLDKNADPMSNVNIGSPHVIDLRSKIPRKDWCRLFSANTDDFDNVAKEYEIKRRSLLAEVTQLIDDVLKKDNSDMNELVEHRQFLPTYPLRRLETLKIKFLGITTPMPVLQHNHDQVLFESSMSKDAAIGVGEYFVDKMSYDDLIDHLGLILVENDSRFALVTKQLDTLIDGYTEERLAPYSNILNNPTICARYGLKDIRSRDVSAVVKIDGNPLILSVPFYLKDRSKNRILVAQLPSNNQGTVLLLPVKWLKNGFHDGRYNNISLFNGGSISTKDPSPAPR
ncbi:MAG: ankyrin repeat domain-containing protein [Gammaproteobacteria bacterium]|nr:ankyrin repeat domain-containing protein [Gammaproteobacteria bacterium]